MTDLLQRAAYVRALDHLDRTILVGADGVARELVGASARLAATILRAASRPTSRDELLAAAATDGWPREEATLALDLLQSLGMVQSAVTPSPRPAGAKVRLLLAVCGAVGAMDAPQLVRELLARGFDLRVAMTRGARRFVRPEVLRYLTHQPVHTGLWSGAAEAPVPHIDLAAWAQLVVVWPASATTISRIAHGDFSTLVSAVALTTRAPVLVAPSMNEAMLDCAAVRRNLEQIRADGFFLAHSALGHEVADAPADRRPARGPAPPPSVMADLAESVFRLSGTSGRPRTAAEWDAVYAGGELPWQEPALEEDVSALLAAWNRDGKASLLDVGAGTGATARAAAALGYRVTALDLSARALAEAARLGGPLPIEYVQRSVLDGLPTAFDVVHDRGCLHCLPRVDWPRYVEAMARVLRPGAPLIVKVHSQAGAPTEHCRPGELGRLFAGSFTVESETVSRLAQRPALLTVLRRA